MDTANKKEIKNKEKHFEINSNKNIKIDFKLINKGNSLLISAHKKICILEIEYEAKFDLESIREKCELFRVYYSIDECLGEIFKGIDNEKIIVNEGNDSLNLIISLGNTKYKSIEFNIKEKVKAEKEIIEELYGIINNQDKEINDLKSKNNNLKNKVEYLENYMEKNINSNIIIKECEKEKLIQLLKKGIKSESNFNIIHLNLLFRASIDGDNIKAFHKCCDNISPTVSIIQTKDNFVFGGYTDHIWDNSSQCVTTDNTFMFSLNKNKIYNGKKGSFHIHCGTNEGPWFCLGSGIQGDNYFSNNKSYQWELESNKKHWEGFTEEFELVGGKKKIFYKRS